MASDTNNPPNKEHSTARYLAYSFVAIYAAILLLIGIVAAIYERSQTSGDHPWLDLLKSGFLLLGGGLTTIIGYYFGSQGVEDAQRVADIAKEQYESLENDLAISGDEMAPTKDEKTLTPRE